ncbi:MAG: VOC family protein [Candidatus Acidiferrales bacterium]
MSTKWPADMQVVQVRFGRPTDKLDEVVKFYTEGLGLKIVGSFQDHDGYSGYMLGLPGRELHLEFTQHADGSSCPAPSRDNLLVLYMPDRGAIHGIVNRLQQCGYDPVDPENLYWAEKGVTFEDPDGWRVVLMNTAGI